jgi:RNA 2',3'-cyclic 3'-phosphodiesterase
MISQIRAFIAIELPPDIKTVLKGLQLKLKLPGSNAVKWVDPANIHLTLKFLGNITSTQIASVTATVRSAAHTAKPFQLQVQSMGAFPNLNRVQVIWVGLDGSIETLLNLQKALDVELAKQGFAPENRPFSPHLTLGRVRETATLIDKQNIGKAISAINVESGYRFNVQALNLMQSRLLPGGPVYTCLQSVEL